MGSRPAAVVDLAEIQRLFAIERRRRSLVFGRLF
jgi:hypothetical protein